MAEASDSARLVRGTGRRYGPHVLPSVLCCLVVFDWVWPLQGGSAAIQAHHPNQIRLGVSVTPAWSSRSFEAQRLYVLVPFSLGSGEAAVLNYSSGAGLSYYESRVVLVVLGVVYVAALYHLLKRLKLGTGQRRAAGGAP